MKKYKGDESLLKRKIQISEMRKAFIDAAAEIIETEGIEKVTARKVAKKIGYASSSIYNYFDDFSHLIFFASMRFTMDYLKEATDYLTGGRNAIDAYLLTWDCFCRYSFANPKIYHAIFLADLGGNTEGILEQYFSIYEDAVLDVPDEFKPIVFEHDISKRSRGILERAVKEGYLEEDDIDDMNEMGVLIWSGMLVRFINNRSSLEIEEAVRKTMKYLRNLVFSVVKQDKKIEITL